MSTGDHSLVSARARRRDEALDPQDLAAREAGYPDYRTFKEQTRRSRLATLVRAAVAVVLLGAVVVATAALWRSGTAADIAGWAESQVGGAAVVDTTPTPTIVERPVVVATIATTDGRGVAARDACREEARSGGAFDEGASVTVLERGLGDCSGWSLVEAGGLTSWVRNIFLEVAPFTGAGAESAD